MIGELTFDKSSQNVSLLLYSVLLIHEYGNNNTIRRNNDPNSFVERMAALIGSRPYTADGREVRTIFNKSLYAQYYGFISRFKDADGKECLAVTQRGKRLLRYIDEDVTANSYESRYYIKPENRKEVQNLLWDSVLFETHGKHNAGAQTSNTDVDPLGVVFKTIFTLGYASNDEIFYVLFGLNKGDSGQEDFDKSFDELISDIRTNRANDEYDYSPYFEDWGVVNKVSDAKLINILADPNFDVLTKKDSPEGIEYNYISDSCDRFLYQSSLVREVSLPRQFIVYSRSKSLARDWIDDTILGHFHCPERFCSIIHSQASRDKSEEIINSARFIAAANPYSDSYIIIYAKDEDEFAEKMGDFLPLVNRNQYFESDNFGASASSVSIKNENNIVFPSNIHLIAIIPMSDTITTNPVFDGQFKRINVEGQSPVSLPEPIKKYTEYVNLLKKNYNLILTGAPGTGKTYMSKQIAAALIGECSWSELTNAQRTHVEFVQFHPSFDYTDFVEGLRPNENADFERTDGAFKAFCKTATQSEDQIPFVFIIDEINRGEISKIFGELFYSIEPDYRGADTRVRTQYNNMVKDDDVFAKGFYVPDNVYIIGTMNDIDRSVEAMDFAIRRRFAWREVSAEESAENMGLSDEAKKVMTALNNALKKAGLNEAYSIGGAYFRQLEGEDFASLWNYHLRGIVAEYFRGEPEADTKLKDVSKAYNEAYRVSEPETTPAQSDDVENAE